MKKGGVNVNLKNKQKQKRKKINNMWLQLLIMG